MDGVSNVAYWFDWTILLLIPAFIITAWAQVKVTSTYKKYAKVPVQSGVSGAEFAQTMLQSNNVRGVQLQPVKGQLTDNFDPRSNVVNLSEDIYSGKSIASVAVAAHECGHVLQHETEYGPMKVRAALVPVVNLCSKAALPLILIGLIFAFPPLATIGAWIYFAMVIFQLVTLPVEFNASHRGLDNIKASNVMTAEEQVGAKQMLMAAAMTYVAAMLATFLSFLRLLLISNRRR